MRKLLRKLRDEIVEIFRLALQADRCEAVRDATEKATRCVSGTSTTS